jgi:hypothetical protein
MDEGSVQRLWWQAQGLVTALREEEPEFFEKWGDECRELEEALAEARPVLWPELREEELNEHRTSTSEVE